MRTKIIIITGFALLLVLGWWIAYADSNCTGGSLTGVKCSDTRWITQDDLPFANDLHFKVWQKECGITVNGWDIDITNFTRLSCTPGDQPSHHKCDNDTLQKHAVDVYADLPTVPIPLGGNVRVDVDLYLTNTNTVRYDSIQWTIDGVGAGITVPGTGWRIGPPIPIGGGIYKHEVKIYNDDAGSSLWFTGIQALQTPVDYPDLGTVIFSGSAHPDAQVGPGGYISFEIQTTGEALGQFIYIRFEVRATSATDPIEMIAVAKHPIVRGIPTLTHWGLIILILLLVTAATIVIRRRRRATA